jgi:Spy/CpxP family protein refolding chaperone
MDFLASKRFVTTILIVLVILNVTLLGFLWWQNSSAPKYSYITVARHFTKPVVLKPELALTQAQQQQFTRLRQQHFRKTMPELQKIVSLKKELVNEAVRTDIDTVKIARIAEEIGMHQAMLERSLALHFHELAEVCTPAQRDSLKTMLGHLYTRKYERRTQQGIHGFPGGRIGRPSFRMNAPGPAPVNAP